MTKTAFTLGSNSQLNSVERYAVVGGPIWLCAWVSALDPLASAELRHFGADQAAQAWAWLGASPKQERPLLFRRNRLTVSAIA